MFYVGVDLGKAQDYTALAIVEGVKPEDKKEHYHCRHIERYDLQTPYPVIVDKVLATCRKLPEYELIIDATGVGTAVLDLFRKKHINTTGLTITGGLVVGGDQLNPTVPKRDLVTGAQVLMQMERSEPNTGLAFAKSLPMLDTLIEELQSIDFEISENGRDKITHRSGSHDDIVLAVCIALWAAMRKPEEKTVLFRLDRPSSMRILAKGNPALEQKLLRLMGTRGSHR